MTSFAWEYLPHPSPYKMLNVVCNKTHVLIGKSTTVLFLNKHHNNVAVNCSQTTPVRSIIVFNRFLLTARVDVTVVAYTAKLLQNNISLAAG